MQSNLSRFLTLTPLIPRRTFVILIPKDMDTAEYLDPDHQITTKAHHLAGLLCAAKKTICITGAGVSTSTGIPDYRSGFNTILTTGPGAWETDENKKKYTKIIKKVPPSKAIPSKTHMALSELVHQGLIGHILTQNVDGLHRKSGVPEHKFTEFHGSGLKEVCRNCEAVYIRDFQVRNPYNKETHQTLRDCTNCGHHLYTSVVLFGQAIRPVDKAVAMHEVSTSDFCLTLGSSLRVPPASRYPSKFLNDSGKKLAIVNLQKTYLDDKCDLRINGMCDQVMEQVMEKLRIPIPEFKINRWLSLQVFPGVESSILQIKNYNREKVEISAIKAVELELHAAKSFDTGSVEEEPIRYKFYGDLNFLQCRFMFYGNYEEPDLVLGENDWGSLWEPLVEGREIVFHVEYTLNSRKWKIVEAKPM